VRVRTQFIITMTLFGVTLAVIAISVLATSNEVARIEAQEQIAVEIGRGASELGYLAGDYVLYREDQQRDRWQSLWESVSDELSRLSPRSSETRAIAGSLESDLTRLRDVFDDVAATSGDPSQELASVSWSRMAVQNGSLTFHAVRLAQVLREKKAAVQERNSLAIFTLVVLFGAYFVVNYLIVYRRALRSLAELQAGIGVIGLGRLDYSIPVSRDDEIGDLTRAFNKMTADLRGMTASKTQLEVEIAEREAAEAALRDSVGEIRQLSEARQRELSITKKLLEAAEETARWTDVEELSRRLARILLRLASHSRVTVVAWHEAKREMEVVASEGETPFNAGSRWPVDEVSAAARHAIVKQDTRIWDIDALPEDERGIPARDYRLRYALYVPLVHRGDTVGLIVLDDPGTRAEFGDREIELVRGVAAHAGIAFGNAQLFEAQRQIADRLQEALLVLPDELPGIEFAHAYHSATITTRVGGDFYDLFELSHGHVGVVIGDVAGKGLDAAVLTSMVKNTVRAHANEEGKTPKQILQLTNDIVFKATPNESFVTLFFGMLDCRDGRLVYANAGHTSAALLCSDGTVRKLPSNGPLLGAFAEATFEQAESSLGDGELLFLYTDGLTEARRDGELYGEGRLFDLLTSTTGRDVHEVLKVVVENVLSYAGNKLRDDLAILSLRRTKPGANTPVQQKLEVRVPQDLESEWALAAPSHVAEQRWEHHDHDRGP